MFIIVAADGTVGSDMMTLLYKWEGESGGRVKMMERRVKGARAIVDATNVHDAGVGGKVVDEAGKVLHTKQIAE